MTSQSFRFFQNLVNCSIRRAPILAFTVGALVIVQKAVDLSLPVITGQAVDLLYIVDLPRQIFCKSLNSFGV